MEILELLTSAGIEPAQMSKQIVMFLAAWHVVKKAIKPHFIAIENQITSVAESTKKLAENDSHHSLDIAALKEDMIEVKEALKTRRK